MAGIIAALCQSRITWRGFLWALALMLVSYQMSRATKLGQLVPLLAALAWIGLLLVRSGRDVAGGLLIGVVSAVKIFPAVLIALLFLDRRYKAAWAAAGIMLAAYASSLLLLGMPVHEQWWQPMRDFAGKVSPFFGNQSLLGWFARVGLGYSILDEMPVGSPWLSAAQWMLTLVFAALVIRALRPLSGSLLREHLPLSVGLGTGALLLVIPVSWEHYGLFVLPAAGWAVYRVWMERDAKFWELWLAAAVFLFTMKLTRFYGDGALGRLVSGSQALGLLLLCVWFMRRLARPLRASLSPGASS
jgi:alpha-1,2-mannosyltransferase